MLLPLKSKGFTKSLHVCKKLLYWIVDRSNFLKRFFLKNFLLILGGVLLL